MTSSLVDGGQQEFMNHLALILALTNGLCIRFVYDMYPYYNFFYRFEKGIFVCNERIVSMTTILLVGLV